MTNCLSTPHLNNIFSLESIMTKNCKKINFFMTLARTLVVHLLIGDRSSSHDVKYEFFVTKVI